MRYFYDVGANVGQTFDQYVLPGNFGDTWVYAFEPSPRHLSALRAKADLVMRLAPRPIAGVTIVPAALGRLLGLQRLYEKTTLLSDSLRNDWRRNLETDVVVEVPVLPLSAFIQSHSRSDDRIEIKLDVEGAECDILENLLTDRDILPRIASLHVEWHGDDPRRVALVERLAQRKIAVQRWMF